MNTSAPAAQCHRRRSTMCSLVAQHARPVFRQTCLSSAALRDFVGQEQLIANVGLLRGVEQVEVGDLALSQIAGFFHLLVRHGDIGAAQVQLVARRVVEQGLGSATAPLCFNAPVAFRSVPNRMRFTPLVSRRAWTVLTRSQPLSFSKGNRRSPGWRRLASEAARPCLLDPVWTSGRDKLGRNYGP